MNNFPKNSYQDNNSKNRMVGLSPTPINAIFPNQSTDPNTFLTENVQNINQFRYSTDMALSRGIINNNAVKYSKNPAEYGLYLDRKEFKLEMPLYPNIADNLAAENVIEHVIIIDSSDRNTSIYPSPFILKTFFNQSDDTTRLNIPRAFENVKFMRIENVILPRQYLLIKYTIANLSNDPVVPSDDIPIVSAVLTEVINQTSTGHDVASPLTTPNSQTVEIINLKTYTYTVNITNGNKSGVYTVVYPSDTTYNKQYYSYTQVSGSAMNGYDLDTYLENANYNMVTSIGGTKSVSVANTYDLVFTLNTITPISVIVKFMVNNAITTRRTYEFNTKLNTSSGLLDFYYFSSKTLDADRYIMLNIEEINDNNVNSTNSALRDAFCLLSPDSYGEMHYYASTNYQDKIYKMSNLGNINRLTLTLKDSYGNQLLMPNMDFHINTNKTCSCDGTDYGCPCTYIRHPYYKWSQVQYMIKLGVVETEIDKKIFY
jgi:hypothetical protein